jgi:hypothetical protein
VNLGRSWIVCAGVMIGVLSSCGPGGSSNEVGARPPVSATTSAIAHTALPSAGAPRKACTEQDVSLQLLARSYAGGHTGQGVRISLRHGEASCKLAGYPSIQAGHPERRTPVQDVTQTYLGSAKPADLLLRKGHPASFLLVWTSLAPNCRTVTQYRVSVSRGL